MDFLPQETEVSILNTGVFRSRILQQLLDITRIMFQELLEHCSKRDQCSEEPGLTLYLAEHQCRMQKFLLPSCRSA